MCSAGRESDKEERGHPQAALKLVSTSPARASLKSVNSGMLSREQKSLKGSGECLDCTNSQIMAALSGWPPAVCPAAVPPPDHFAADDSERYCNDCRPDEDSCRNNPTTHDSALPSLCDLKKSLIVTISVASRKKKANTSQRIERMVSCTPVLPCNASSRNQHLAWKTVTTASTNRTTPSAKSRRAQKSKATSLCFASVRTTVALRSCPKGSQVQSNLQR